MSGLHSVCGILGKTYRYY